jgi:ParB-like chromosome segregation protein Spo0J
MKVEFWPTDRPIPYARNARKISQVAVDKVASSIKEFGWRQPIVVDGEGVVIAGHTRLLAAKKLSLPEVPVHIAEGLSKQQVKAYRLMDNRSHEEAEWDKELLGPELLELEALDIDLALTASILTNSRCTPSRRPKGWWMRTRRQRHWCSRSVSPATYGF